MLGDKAYDSAELRQWLSERGTKPIVPNKSNRKQPFSFDRKSYTQRHRIENAFCRLKDFRRIATRYDRLARNFLASVCLVARGLFEGSYLEPSLRFSLSGIGRRGKPLRRAASQAARRLGHFAA